MSRKIHLFVDSSNITIMAQKASGRKLGFPERVDDRCVRVIPSQLWDFIENREGLKSRCIEEMIWYTSETAQLDQADIGERNIKVKSFPRSGFNKKEKQLDCYLVADAVEKICLSDPNKPQTIALCTGDLDILEPVTKKASKYGCGIEIWSFKGSLSAKFSSGSNQTTSTMIYDDLDDYVPQFTKRAVGCNAVPSNSPTFKLRFTDESFEKIKINHWRKIVEQLTSQVKLPLQGHLNYDEKFMTLVVSVPERSAHFHLKKLQDPEFAKEIQQKMIWFCDLEYQLNNACTIELNQNATQHNFQTTETGSFQRDDHSQFESVRISRGASRGTRRPSRPNARGFGDNRGGFRGSGSGNTQH